MDKHFVTLHLIDGNCFVLVLGRGSTVSLYCTGIMRSNSSRGTKMFKKIPLPYSMLPHLSPKYEMICVVRAAVIRVNFPRNVCKAVARQVLRQIHQD